MLFRSRDLEPTRHNKKRHHNGTPGHGHWRLAPALCNQRQPEHSNEDPHSHKQTSLESSEDSRRRHDKRQLPLSPGAQRCEGCTCAPPQCQCPARGLWRKIKRKNKVCDVYLQHYGLFPFHPVVMKPVYNFTVGSGDKSLFKNRFESFINNSTPVQNK